jgi:transposase
VTEQRYKAVLAVIGDGRTMSEVATDWGVSRRTMHRWLVRYEGDGLEGLNNRSHRPARCRHQMAPTVEAVVLEMRRSHPYRRARRIAFELERKRLSWRPQSRRSIAAWSGLRSSTPSADSGAGNLGARPMELWQLDLVHYLVRPTAVVALKRLDHSCSYLVLIWKDATGPDHRAL